MKALLLIIVGFASITVAIVLINKTKNRYREKAVLVPVQINSKDDLDWNKGMPALDKVPAEEITKDINDTSTATVDASVPNF